MRFIGVLGVMVLLGLAWAMSYHKRDVRPRVVLWGLGLQFLFALIILRNDYWSFVGMGVLGVLVAVYVLRRDPVTSDRGYGSVAALLVGASAVSAVLGFLGPPVVGIGVIILLIALLVNTRFKLAPALQAPLGALLVTSIVAWLVASGFHGRVIFEGLSQKVAAFLDLSDYGARFLFGNLADRQYFFPGGAANWPGFGFQFAFKVLPTIIFFGGFMAVLYYLGIMQRVIETLARFMRWTVGTSGAETLSCTANIFVGQTEAPLLIKPFLPDMTRSELLTVMVGGFATIAGGVLAAYIAMGIDAGHLIAASVMSAPAALLVGKIIYPELEHSVTAGDVEMPDIDSGGNVIEAAANGITDGLKLAVNVGAMLIGFIALIAVLDVALNWLDSLIDGRLLNGAVVTYSSGGMSPVVSEFKGIFPGSLQTLFGVVLRPLAWVMGVPWNDAGLVGNLLGIKLSLNELVAYGLLGTYIQEGALSARAVTISTYALCGFANFSSIGIQLGGIAAVAPNRRADLASLGLKAMFGGAIASWLTATIAGLLL
ncbi:MAG: NupC/NupG family nucleoside CNT transporter [Acidobacteria bacterium]|jgi:CNT family concentrative nucleoside transporter|nr:NupC/NupG family nucleoside CNT transporter [Acidobacteriota bacterium]